MTQVKEKQKKAFDELKSELGITNAMEAPRIEKVVVSTGVGKITDRGQLELIQDRLAKITGQKPVPCAAKKSIATFKTREGQTIGYRVTLRGQRMYDFLERFLQISLARTRDFRGISRTAVDGMGNITIGVKEHTVFPETADEELKDVFGLAVTIVTSANNRGDAEKFFEYIGVPFKKKSE